MKLIFFRHGPAGEALDYLMTHKDDRKRPLTDEGMEETRRAAESLVKILKAEKFKIFTSPWTRALQTAEILAEVSSSAVEVFDGLIPPTELSKIQSKINETRGSIVFVGHNPDLSQIVCELMGANLDSISLKKAGVAILNRTGYDAWELEHLLTRSDLLRFSR